MPRSIPAYAGEPGTIDLAFTVDAVYPRVCGGTGVFVQVSAAVVGLSPRMRGNQASVWAGILPAGSIPAYAGEPGPFRFGGGVIRVYPRVCGGTAQQSADSADGVGLSPRMRGNLGTQPEYRLTLGSIPAYAGEPGASPNCGHLPEVYPRVCGGTALGYPAVRVGSGLSPRMRGNRR